MGISASEEDRRVAGLRAAASGGGPAGKNIRNSGRAYAVAKLDVLLASYVAACLPVIGDRRHYPALSDPERDDFAAALRDAIAAQGWPSSLAEVLSLQQAAEAVLCEGSLEGTPANVALTGIELAFGDRMAARPIRSEADFRAKLAWLHRELLGSAANPDLTDALRDALAWLDRQRGNRI